jgi:fructokinase
MLPDADVFFADRVSPGILALAEKCAKSGAIVVFEPSSVNDEALFERMLRIAHIVKYSNDRLTDLPVAPRETTYLEVQTLGKGGLRYRAKVGELSAKGWTHCEPYDVRSPLDTAGAGDWCTGGILHVIGTTGLRGLQRLSANRLQDAMRFGQALASWNCGFEGARGGMYEQTQAQCRDSVKAILRAGASAITDSDVTQGESSRAVARVCSDCRRDDRRHLFDRLHAAS